MCTGIHREAGRVCLVINPVKTKYMRFSPSPARRSVKSATIHGITYDGVAEFIYLGTLINKDNCVEKEIQRRILAGNRTYFAAINLFKSRLLSRATKIKLYKTLIRPVVLYEEETWTLVKKEEQAPLIVEEKYLEEYMAPNTKIGNGKAG